MKFEQHYSVKNHKQKAARIRGRTIPECFKTASPARTKADWWYEAQFNSSTKASFLQQCKHKTAIPQTPNCSNKG
jgi:hypothetical protein